MEEVHYSQKSCNLENLLELANDSQNNGKMGPSGSISEEMNEYPQNSFFKGNISNLDVSGPNDRDMLMNILKEQNQENNINQEKYSKSSPESSDSDHSEQEDTQNVGLEGIKKNIKLENSEFKTISFKSQINNNLTSHAEDKTFCN